MAGASDRPLLVVLRPLGLGDLLTAVPAFRALADAFPGHRRVLAAPKVLEPLALLTGALEALVDTAPLRPLAPELRHADVAVDLHGKGPASHHVLLASRPRRLVAFANPEVPGTAGLPPWREGEHEVHRWCRLLEGCGIPADPGRLDLEPPPVEPPARARGATVVHPGAAYPARRWPLERWAAVARHEVARGRPVVVTGGPQEQALAGDVAARAGLGADAVLAGRTGLGELAAAVAAAGRVVSADTGVAHLATALRTPSVVLFGPESPARWGPPPDRPWHRALWAGRRGDPRGSRPDPGLLALGVDDVVAALDVLPGAPVSPVAASGSRRSTR
ncbi:MAG TPA: glycosyltransferase family 9 protein [Acidimicrobiales bacterium]|nr:glycosyltransferase family 9 protein [Acidimicrobiales bacterium]